MSEKKHPNYKRMAEFKKELIALMEKYEVKINVPGYEGGCCCGGGWEMAKFVDVKPPLENDYMGYNYDNCIRANELDEV